MSLAAAMNRLYAEQIAADPSPYLAYHASEQAIASKIASFDAYREFIPRGPCRVLDWGCQHGPDSFMVRQCCSDATIIGADFLPTDRYPIWWNASALQFVRLDHRSQLPFESDSFDMVIAGGVLEHTAQDYESLKEVYRVLKPGGHLAITHLPNWLSYTEFLARNVRKADFHRRLYSVSGIVALLKQSGFYPVRTKRHRLLPSNSLRSVTRRLAPYENVIDRIWPMNIFAGDILAVAQKVDCF